MRRWDTPKRVVENEGLLWRIMVPLPQMQESLNKLLFPVMSSPPCIREVKRGAIIFPASFTHDGMRSPWSSCTGTKLLPLHGDRNWLFLIIGGAQRLVQDLGGINDIRVHVGHECGRPPLSCLEDSP